MRPLRSIVGRWRWHWSALLAVAFLAVVALTLAIRGGRWAAARWGGVTGGAQWIWLEHERRAPQPLAFYLARDFSLPAVLPASARLLVLGDPEYVLYLNGQRVGAGGWLPGDRVDVYEVASLLRQGGNRLVAELRSADGGGGFLASLVDGGNGHALVVSDARWRAFRRNRLGLVRGWLPVTPFFAAGGGRGNAVSAAGAGFATLSWGRPPIGRWGRITPGWRRPLFSELTAGQPQIYAASTTVFQPPAVSRVAADGSMLLFDWGREVTGYLELEPGYEPGLDPDLVPAPPNLQRTALVWTGDQPPQPIGTGLEPSAELVLMPSAHLWLDARLRRFRYALVVGLPRPLGARVDTVDGAIVARYQLPVGLGRAAAGWRGTGYPAPPSAPVGLGDGGPSRPATNRGQGVFGLPPPRLRTPMEDEVRRQLKSVPSTTGGKEL
jgi:hypothetical protein